MTVQAIRPEGHVDQVANVHTWDAPRPVPCEVNGCTTPAADVVEFGRADSRNVCGPHRHDFYTALLHNGLRSFRARIA